MKTLKIIGMIVGLQALVMAWIFYDWKLAVIIALALWGNNLEQANTKK